MAVGAGTGAGGRPVVLQAKGITKRFGPLVANNAVDLTIHRGEIHALLGENGAGKSTLVKILYGALQPNEGEILWHGKPAVIANPAEARALGIGMVFQHFSLFEALTVAENVALGMSGEQSLAEITRRIEEVSASFGLSLDPTRVVHDLSVGERQRIEIVRALLQDPELLIMDEPTSVLTPQEADQMFATLRRLSDEGRSILYITHRLDEMRVLCDGGTVLRQGKVVGHVDPSRETAKSLARLMVGSEVKAIERPPAPAATKATARLAVKDLSLPSPDMFGMALKSISLEVKGGEIVAIAGVAGNGQGEFFDALSGERRSPAGAVSIDGKPAGNLGVTQRRRRGACFVPEERLGHGAAPRMRLSDNVILTRHATAGLVRAGVLMSGKARTMAQAVIDAFDVRKGGRDPEAGSLSGGNLQKFVVGREVMAKPGVLVVNQPTWGVDAGAAATIRQALIDLARGGAAVLVISQDLDEILEIADRIAVIAHGHLSETYPAADLTLEKIGLLMGGASASDTTGSESMEAAGAH